MSTANSTGPVTSKQLAKARIALDLLQVRPDRVEKFMADLGLHPETRAAYHRGLQAPVDLRAWAEGVIARWKKENRI